MKANRWIGFLLMLASVLPLSARARGPLTFEERVKVQEAIERVYYNHRIWPKENPQSKPPFEQMMPRAVIEAKVADYLKRCNALSEIWQRPITAEQIQAEMDRMARETRDPAVLRELFATLENDPLLIGECLVRPLLADRLARSWYASDEQIHGGLKAEAEALAARLTPGIFESLGGARYGAVRIEAADRTVQEEDSQAETLRLPPDEFARAVAVFPEEGRISGVEETPEAFVIRMTVRKDVGALEGGILRFKKAPFEAWLRKIPAPCLSNVTAEGAPWVLPETGRAPLGDPTSPDSWKTLSYVPTPRAYHSAVWTGTEMIVWGGRDTYGNTCNDGGRYNPATDSWVATSTGANCPTARYGQTAIWTGTEMIVWGGLDSGGDCNTGGRYTPSSDAWVATSTTGNCPAARLYHTAVWTGSAMIIWGGQSTVYFNTGALYDPVGGGWTPTSTGTNCPGARSSHTAVWTGSLMIVWGGRGGLGYLVTGGRYAPAGDTWAATSTSGACPSVRTSYTAIWTGSVMIIWGGEDTNNGSDLNTGGQYDPAGDSWTATSTTGACPIGRSSHTAVWASASGVMIVWGGTSNSSATNTGGRYDPGLNTWAATSTTSAPAARSLHTAVWTGSVMIVWGGVASNYANTGGRYDPSLNSWTPTATYPAGLPSWRCQHTAVWTGTEMIVWGGYDNRASTTLNTGGRYNVATDSWTATSTLGACPSSRRYHSAVWTGSAMIVWGGQSYSGTFYNTGGSYDPGGNAWTAISTAGSCPAARDYHTAVWTGTQMIIWGGIGAAYYNTGGLYTPSSDSWATTSTASPCPARRDQHAAVWTGTEMIVWGGFDGTSGSVYYNDGGRYSPTGDSWTALPTPPATLYARVAHTAVWTGTEVIIWGGSNGPSNFYNTGARYSPSGNSWTSTSTGTNCPTTRSQHTAVWTGTEMIIWNGSGAGGVRNDGGRYSPATDTWAAMVLTGCPSPRYQHSAVWTGQEMIIWDGLPQTDAGGIFYPNTPPRALMSLTTTGGDTIFWLGVGETLSLDGSASTDGSNPYTTTPYNDALDAIVTYEWDLTGDAHYGTQCATSSSGVDRTGVTATLTESDLAALGLMTPGVYPVWLRVTDKLGLRNCTSQSFTVAQYAAPQEDSPAASPMLASLNKGTGQVHVTYTAACGTTGNAVYWGILGQVSSYTWSGSQCVSGSGAIDFTPPGSDLFFVVVGNNGSFEGSYGKDSSGVERPEAVGVGACDMTKEPATCGP